MRDRRFLLAGFGGSAAVLVGLAVWGALSADGFAGFFWRHFAGPVAAQAQGHPVAWNGIPGQVGYSVPSLIGYGALLVAGILAADVLLLQRLGLRPGWGLAIALAPFFVFGPLARALQVAGMFGSAALGGFSPLAYAVVEPVVYVTTAVLAVGALALASVLSRWRSPVAVAVAVVAVWLLTSATLSVAGAPYTWRNLSFSLPVVALALVLAFLLPRTRLEPVAASALPIGLAFLAPFLLHATASIILMGAFGSREVFPWLAPAVLVAALVAGLAVMVTGRAVRGAVPRLAPLASPAAGLLVFAHAVDGFSTIIGVKDPFGWGLPLYQEQNPVSLALLNVAGGWAFVAVKLLVGALTALVLHEFAAAPPGENQEADRGNLVFLGYLAVFALGWGPGFTNLLRSALGV